MYGPCCMPAPLQLPLVTLMATKRPDMTYVDPSEKPKDSMKSVHGAFGRACHTSWTTSSGAGGVTTSQSTLPDELNEFYARFDDLNTNRGILPTEAAQSSSLTVTSAEVCRALRRTNPQKAVGPDNIEGLFSGAG